MTLREKNSEEKHRHSGDQPNFLQSGRAVFHFCAVANSRRVKIAIPSTASIPLRNTQICRKACDSSCHVIARPLLRLSIGEKPRAKLKVVSSAFAIGTATWLTNEVSSTFPVF